MAIFLTLLKTWALKALYGLAGLLGAYLLMTVPAFQPTGATEAFLWKWALAPALIGLAAVLKRLGQAVVLKSTGPIGK